MPARIAWIARIPIRSKFIICVFQNGALWDTIKDGMSGSAE